MYFDSLSDFLAMGKYGAYVWSAYGITFLCFLALIIKSVSKSKSLKKDIRQKIDREARLRAAKNMENTL